MSDIAIVTRRLSIIAAAAACLLLLAAPSARADAAAENFVAGVLVEANEVFKIADEAARDAGIEALVDKYVDMPRVGNFVLGQYAHQITDAQKEEYFPLFRKYARLVYLDVLSAYSGERLVVEGSVDRTDRDVVVNCRVADAGAGDEFAETVVHWRVYRAADGAMSIFDAGADGVWLAIEQQSQFKSVIANNGGGAQGIDALIADLRAKVGG